MVNKLDSNSEARNLLLEMYQRDLKKTKELISALNTKPISLGESIRKRVEDTLTSIFTNCKPEQKTKITEYLVKKLESGTLYILHHKVMTNEFLSPRQKEIKKASKEDIKQKKEFLTKEFNTENSEFNRAIQSNDIKTISKYIRDGYDFNIEDDDLNCPLHIAVRYEKNSEMIALLSRLCDKNKQNFVGLTPLYDAIDINNIEAVETLLKNGVDANKGTAYDLPIHKAADKGLLEILQLLVPKTADLNAQDGNGNTPLHLAAFHNHFFVVQHLIENGANPNALNIGKLTPLHFALLQNNSKVVEYLLGKGADANIKDEMERVCLHTAAILGFLDIVELLSNYTNLNVQNFEGKTPLMLAAEEGHLEVVKYLLENGADSTLADKKGVLPHEKANGAAIFDLLINAKTSKIQEPPTKKRKAEQ